MPLHKCTNEQKAKKANTGGLCLKNFSRWANSVQRSTITTLCKAIVSIAQKLNKLIYWEMSIASGTSWYHLQSCLGTCGKGIARTINRGKQPWTAKGWIEHSPIRWNCETLGLFWGTHESIEARLLSYSHGYVVVVDLVGKQSWPELHIVLIIFGINNRQEFGSVRDCPNRTI